jgi:hypothetical protein
MYHMMRMSWPYTIVAAAITVRRMNPGWDRVQEAGVSPRLIVKFRDSVTNHTHTHTHTHTHLRLELRRQRLHSGWPSSQSIHEAPLRLHPSHPIFALKVQQPLSLCRYQVEVNEFSARETCQFLVGTHPWVAALCVRTNWVATAGGGNGIECVRNARCVPARPPAPNLYSRGVFDRVKTMMVSAVNHVTFNFQICI